MPNQCVTFFFRLWKAGKLPFEESWFRKRTPEDLRFLRRPELLIARVVAGRVSERGAVDFLSDRLTVMTPLRKLFEKHLIKVNLRVGENQPNTISTKYLVNMCALHLTTEDGTLGRWPVNFLTALDTISPNFGATVCKQYRFAVVTPPARALPVPPRLIDYLRIVPDEIGGYDANSESTNRILNAYVAENRELMGRFPALFGGEMLQGLNRQ